MQVAAWKLEGRFRAAHWSPGLPAAAPPGIRACPAAVTARDGDALTRRDPRLPTTCTPLACDLRVCRDLFPVPHLTTWLGECSILSNWGIYLLGTGYSPATLAVWRYNTIQPMTTVYEYSPKFRTRKPYLSCNCSMLIPAQYCLLDKQRYELFSYYSLFLLGNRYVLCNLLYPKALYSLQSQ